MGRVDGNMNYNSIKIGGIYEVQVSFADSILASVDNAAYEDDIVSIQNGTKFVLLETYEDEEQAHCRILFDGQTGTISLLTFQQYAKLIC